MTCPPLKRRAREAHRHPFCPWTGEYTQAPREGLWDTILMGGAILRLPGVCGPSTCGVAGRHPPGVCRGREVSAPFGCVQAGFGGKTGLARLSCPRLILPWMGKEPSGCANQYRASIAQNRFNIIAWKWITSRFLAQLQLHPFLQASDTITLPLARSVTPTLVS